METLSELDKIGAELLQKMPEYLQAGVNYGGDLMERFISYSLLSKSLWYLILIPCGVAFYYWIKFAIKEKKDSCDMREIINFLTLVFVAAIGGITVGVTNAIIKLCTIPELYIVEHFAQ